MAKCFFVFVLSFLLATTNTRACDKTEQDAVVSVNEPVEFTVLVKDSKGDNIRLFSEKKFVVGNGHEERFQNEEGWYLLRVSPGGKDVVFKYKLHGLEPRILSGHYEYIRYSTSRCLGSVGGSKWVFVQDR